MNAQASVSEIRGPWVGPQSEIYDKANNSELDIDKRTRRTRGTRANFGLWSL